MNNDSINRRDLLLAAAAVSLPFSAARSAVSDELPGITKELWAWVRAQQVIDPGLAYLDTAGGGPVLRAALVTQYRNLESLSLDPCAYRKTVADADGLRQSLQRLATWLGCNPDELTLTTGATESLNIVAAGLDLQPGDEVLTTTHDHDAALYPWLLQARRRGIAIKPVYLPSPISGPEEIIGRLAGAVTSRTRVMAFAHVQYSDGTVLPVRELCAFARERGILTVVDGAQALGMSDVGIQGYGCDFYAGTFHKWTNAPKGLGCLYVRPEAADRLWPLQVRDHFGWQAEDRFGRGESPSASPNPLSGAPPGAPTGASADERRQWPLMLRKFCTCLPQSGPALQALLATLDFQERVGRARLEARIRELAIYARLRLQSLPGLEFLTPNHPALSAGILSFRLAEAPHAALARTLYEENRVAVRHVQHEAGGSSPAFDALRISTHAFNSHDDIDRLVRALQIHG